MIHNLKGLDGRPESAKENEAKEQKWQLWIQLQK
jgi:hypothetical protein